MARLCSLWYLRRENMARFSIAEARQLKENLAPIYDIVRFVDAKACKVIHFEEDGSIRSEGRCFTTWGRTHRCRYCTSFCADSSKKNMEKDEVTDEKIFHVLSAPVELELADKSIVNCVMELVTKYPRSAAVREMRDRDVLHLLSHVKHTSRTGVLCFNVEDVCIYANLEAYRLFQVPPGELELLRGFFATWLKDASWESPWEDTMAWEQEFFLDGEKFIYKVTMAKLFDGDGRYKGYYYLVHDKCAEIEARKEASSWTRDKLTGLYDREGFYAAVRDEIDYGMKSKHCIICSNIKDFKLVNELLGEEEGNAMLKSLAEFFSELAMASGTAGRLHSDHFAAYVDKASFTEQELLEGLKKIGKAFSSNAFKLNVHLGVYEIEEVQMPVSVMCDRAHLALNLVREENGNKVAFYDGDLLERTLHEKEILNSFEDGLVQRQFAVYLQPQVSTEGDLLGAEALVRWIHPEKGVLSPGFFIGILENAGLIHWLDQYVWEEAAAILKSWQGTEKEGLTISVNISVSDMVHLDIFDTITDIVARHGIDPRQLKLEITETTLMGDIEKYRVLIGRLQEAGFEVEIDDFGSGYSSLSMLKDIEADILKIDMGFLSQTRNPKRSSVILNAVIAMAKWLGMRVITEGVETKEQVERLRSFGCDMFQGYFFAKPMPVEEFEAKYFQEASNISAPPEAGR